MKVVVLSACLLLLHVVSAQLPGFDGKLPGFSSNSFTFPPNRFTFPPNIGKTNLPSACDPKSHNYLKCCSRLLSVDCLKRTLGNLNPKDLSKTSCSSLVKLLSHAGTAKQVQNFSHGLKSTSSPCLKSAIAAGFKHAYGSPKNWNSSVFHKAPISAISQFDTSSLKGLSASLLKNMSSLARLGQAMKKMTPGQVKSVSSGLKKAYGDYSRWAPSTMKNVLSNAPNFVCGLDSKSIQSFPKKSVVDSFGKVVSAVKSCGKDERSKVNFPQHFLSLFKSHYGDVDLWNVSTFKSIGDFKSQLTPGALLKLHSDILKDPSTLMRGDKSFAPHQKLALAAALRKHFNMSGNASKAVSEMLEKLPSIFSSLDESEISEANCSDVHKHFLASAFSRVPKLSARALVKRAKECGLRMLKAGAGQNAPTSDDISQVNSDGIKTLSDYFSSFKSDDLESLGTSQVKDAFKTKMVGQTLQGLDMPQGRGLLRALQVHLKQKGQSADVAINKLGLLAGMLSRDEADNGDFNLADVQNISSDVFKKRPDLRRVFAEKAISSLGTNFTDDTKWPANTKFGELGGNIVTGLNRTTWKNLPEDDYEGFATQAAKFSGFSQGQAKQIMKRHYSKDWAKDATEEDVRSLGNFVCQMNSSVMAALSDAAKMQVVRNLGQSDRIAGFCGNKTRIQNLLTFALQAMKKSSPTSHINVTDVQTLGKLAKKLSASQLDGMTKGDLEASTYQLTHDVDGDDVEDHLKKVAAAVYKKSANPSNKGLPSGLVQNLGRAACHLPDAFFSSLSAKMTFDDQVDNIGQQKCEPNSKAALSIVKAAKNHWGNVSEWTETHIRRLNQSLGAMDSSDLMKLTHKVVGNTLDTLGKAYFSHTKAAILAGKLPGMGKMGGARGNLTGTQMKSIGRLSCVVPPGRFGDHLKDTDVLCAVSKQDCFNKTQRKDFLGMLKNVTKATSDISSWGEKQLSCLGKFSSELLPTDISSISNSALKSSVHSLGKQDFPDVVQRKAFSDRLKSAYGHNIRNWKESEVSTMGNLIGHLGQGRTDAECKSDVGQLTSDQIGAINVSTIPNLYNLKCFSEDQLKSFDGEQARAVTATQKEQLSSAQQNALVSVTCDPDCDTQSQTANPGNSGAGSVVASFTSFVGLLIFVILF